MKKIYETLTPTQNRESPPVIGVSTDVRQISIEEFEIAKKDWDDGIAEIGKKYLAKHSWLTEKKLCEIYRTEQKDLICAGCTGLPCKKSIGLGLRYVTVFYDDWKSFEVKTTKCKYFKAHRKQQEIARKFINSRIPERYFHKTFNDYKVDEHNSDAVAWAKWLVSDPQDGLLLYGEPGCGKTFLAAIMAQEFLNQNKSVIFGDVPSILQDLKSTFNSKDENLDDLMCQLKTVDMLILDDLGTEYTTDWAITQLYLIINNRYNANKPIIATTNYSPEELSRKFKETTTGKRIISRLKHMCEPVLISGNDRRKR